MISIRENEPLYKHCRFNIGGPADYFCQVVTAPELVEAVNYSRENNLKLFVFAGGSNLFFDDSGFRGLVVKIFDGGYNIDRQSMTVTVSSGFKLGKLVRELAVSDLGGIDYLANIPGSIGGAVVGNAGCYGKEIKDVLVRATVMDLEDDLLIDVEPEFFEFDYRHSKLKYTDRYIITGVTLRLAECDGPAVLAGIEEELDDRMKKHPHSARCAGSYFKNPSRENPAWRVITAAGMASASANDASLSPLHANFLVNNANASSKDVIELTRLIQQTVMDRKGINLVPEVRYIGPSGPEDILLDR